MKKYLLFASALLAFASCANDNYLGTEDEQRLAQGEKPITFGSGLNSFTRADKTGAAAATDLNGKFYVWGIKKEGGTGGNGINEASSGNLVYSNYVVEWTDNSAMTTTSNTKGWEYVGKTLTAAEQACITASGSTNPDNGGSAVQTIKYWDWGAEDYTFYAFTADPADFATSSAKITVVKTESVASPKTVYDKGYILNIAAGANLDKLYFAERVNVTKSSNTERTVPNQYGGNVTFRFHNTATKVRVAMYETIPGYTVTIKKFKVDNDADRADVAKPAFGDMTDAVTTNFAANLQNSPKGVAGTMEVVYESETGATQNWPKVKFTPTSGTNIVLNLGTGLKENVVIGESMTGATYDTPDGSDADSEPDYTSVFPQENNSQNLKLKLDYVLTAPVTGETIYVTNATAEIPAAYLKWKPGFAYTYIFKISDNTNGYTDPSAVDPAGLYPITFDAVEMLAEDGSAEYITTVSEPSITTFGVNSTTGKYVTGGNEYAAGSDIYATFVEGSNVKTPILGGNGAQHVNVYTVSSDDDTNFPVTEASVAEAIAKGPSSITGTIYTYDGTDTYTAVANASDLARGTTYYKKDANDVAPGGAGYIQTLAVDGTDYNIASVVKYTAYTTNVTLETTVPTEDNKTITLANSAKALKMASVAAGTYAIEYEASAEWTGSYKKVYKVIKVTAP